MEQVSDIVGELFRDYERGIAASDADMISSLYSDSFVFAGPQGAQVVRREDLLRALPRRQEFFKAAGLASSRLRSLEETRLDDHLVMVKAYWNMQFEKGPGQSLVVETSATYILHLRGDRPRIVIQLDHQDLMKRVQELGLAPSRD
jgi:hypothetical protein